MKQLIIAPIIIILLAAATLTVLYGLTQRIPTLEEYAKDFCTDSEGSGMEDAVTADEAFTYGDLIEAMTEFREQVVEPVPEELREYQSVWLDFIDEVVAKLNHQPDAEVTPEFFIDWYVTTFVRADFISEQAKNAIDDATLEVLYAHGCEWVVADFALPLYHDGPDLPAAAALALAPHRLRRNPVQ